MRRHVVVTGVRNPSHLVYVSSYLRSLLVDGCERVTVAHVGGGRTLGRITIGRDAVAGLVPDDPRIHLTFPTGRDRWRFPTDEWMTYVAVGAPGLKPYGQMLLANPGRHPEVVVTDEGLGSYGDGRTRRAAWARQGVPQPWRTVRSVAVETGLRRLTTERWSLYRERDGGGGWEVDDRVADEFRLRLGPVDPDPGSRTVVMLCQPWTTLGVVEPDTYRAHLRVIADRLAAGGRELAVRPHPSEDRSLYEGFRLTVGEGPAELDPEVVGASAVIGGPSTALLNLAAVHGRPATQLEVPGNSADSLAVGPRQLALLRQFVGDPVPDSDIE